MVISESGGEECSFTGVHNGPSLAMQNRMGFWGLLTLSAQTSALNSFSLKLFWESFGAGWHPSGGANTKTLGADLQRSTHVHAYIGFIFSLNGLHVNERTRGRA